MQFLSITLGLATAVSAIDVRLWLNACDDGGAVLECTNKNPNDCCGIPSGGVGAIGFYGIPLDWQLEVRGHEGGNCIRTKNIETTLTENFKCLTNGPYSGGGYGFRSAKREAGNLSVVVGKKCKRADALVTGDGKRYSLVGLTDGQVDELVGFGFNGTAVPDEYKEFEVVE